MLRSALEEAAIERAAEAIFNFDEDLTDKCREETGITFTEPRRSWSELCLQEPETAIATGVEPALHCWLRLVLPSQ
jgi:hypothetical protein